MSTHNPRDGVARMNELFRQTESGSDRSGPPPRDPVDRERQRHRRRIGRLVTGIVVVVALALSGAYVGLTLSAPIGASAATASFVKPTVTTPPAAAITMPADGEAAITVSGAEQYLGAGGLQNASGGDAALPIASISKLITAMVVLKAKPLTSATDPGPTITFTKDDHALYDKYYLLNATITAMPTGSTMSEHDALETMLVVSATNYAEAVADWAFGSTPAFVSAARSWLRANGLSHTTIVEPTGIDARNTSTPADMLILGKLAKANPAIAAIVKMPGLSVPTLDGGQNTNTLLGRDGVDGIKTGTLDSAGSDLLFSASFPVGQTSDATLTVIGVVLGGDTHEGVDTDVSTMLTSLTAGFHDVTVAEDEQVVGTYRTPWGSSSKMVLTTSASLFTWSNTPITATMSTPKLVTGKDGEQVATVTYTAGTAKVSVPVALKGTITPPTNNWRLTHPKELLPWWP